MPSIRPFFLPETTFDADLWEKCGCIRKQEDPDEEGRQQNYHMIDMLRKIMGVIQDAARNIEVPMGR